MAVHVDEMTTEVVPERSSSPAAGPSDGSGGEPSWKRLARLRRLERRLRSLAERTCAEGFRD